MYLFDTPSLEHALNLPLDPKLRCLLHQRVDHLNALDIDVRDTTYFLVIDQNVTINDVEDELGWSPLTKAFEYLTDHGAWIEMMFAAGNDAIYTLLIENCAGADPALLGLCDKHAG